MSFNQITKTLCRRLFSFFGVWITLVCIVGIPIDAQAAQTDGETSGKHTFRYKFREGDTLQWEVIAQIDQLTSRSGQQDKTETRSTSTKLWKVLEVDAAGTAVLEYSIADVDMKSVSSLANAERSYNSKTDEKPPVEYLDVAELIGTPIAHFTINAQGEVIKRVQKAKTAATMQFAETAEENRITIPMPEHAVGVGDFWDYSREITLPKPNGTVKKIDVRERYTLKRIQNGVATFDFKTTVLTPLYDDKDSEWELRTKIRNGEIQFDMIHGRSILQRYDTKKTAINVMAIGRGSAAYESRFTEKYIDNDLLIASPAKTSNEASQVTEQEKQYVVFEGTQDKPGNGKHIVLISGDEEYRSEQMQTQLAKILARHHGFRCTVLYAIDPNSGEIEPTVVDNIPGLETLETADLVVMFLRFRNLPDEQMQHIVKYLEAGKPIIGLRTSTHAFNIPADRKWAHYSFNYRDNNNADDAGSQNWDGGFGRRVLGETWIDHHGHHKVEATRGVIAPGAEKHPIVIGCNDVFCPTDVYTVRLPLPEGCRPLILGQVLAGMQPTDKPVENAKNDPMMPVLWVKNYQVDNGQTGRAVASTMGAALDMQSEGFRRLMVNSCYWLLDMAADISPDSCVEIIGEFKPLGFGFGQSEKGIKPADLAE